MVDYDSLPRCIAVDFDGTLCTNKWPEIGSPNWPVIRAVQAERAAGSEIILWTAREGVLLDNALMWCKTHGLTFDAVNDSTASWKKAFGTSPRKVGATEYWDDKAVSITDVLRGDMRG